MVLFQAINKFSNPNSGTGAPGNRRRRLYIPPSTNYPLFSYGEGDDQRSFLSLMQPSSVFEGEVSDTASISTSRSLPSTLSSVHTNEDQESFHSWLLEERQRKYSAVSEDEDYHARHSDDIDSIPSNSSKGSYQSSAYNEMEDFENLNTSCLTELKMIFRYAFPLIITFVFEHIFSIVCLLVVGHLGKNELGAVSLATMSSTITLAIFEGIATSLDTLCPQAYGAKNYELVSIHVQRCTIFSWVVFIPCALVWWYSSSFLKYVINDPEVLHLTTTFLRIIIPGGPAYIFFENSKRYLQAQGIFEAGTGVLFISAPINIFLSWFLVWNEKFGLGYIGAPIAIVINFWLMDILLIMYVIFVDGKKCWYGIAPLAELFSQWGNLSQLAIPGIVMLESEYMAYEIMTLFASYFGTVELAAQSTVSSIASLTYMVPFALSIASSTRIANFIGAQNVDAAKKATSAGLIGAFFVATFNCLMLFIFKKQIAGLFTKDEEVAAMIIHLFNPLVSILQIFDGIATVASGILRAQGAQKIGGLINFFCYYAIAIPVALVLSKAANLKLIGLWIGIGIGMLLIGVLETTVILTSDWNAILARAEEYNERVD